MASSSINFQKAKSHSQVHNFRQDLPSYLLPPEYRGENEYWKTDLSPQQIFDLELSNAHRKGGKIPKFENSNWEGVLNLNSNHTLEDVQKVAKHIENKFNISCYSIAIHRDEGHINERGIAIKNLHAHLNFITYKNGKQNWRKEFIKPQNLRDLQTEIANILAMQRGKDKRETGRQRLEHRQFKEYAKKEELKNNILELQKKTIKELSNQLKEELVSKKEIQEVFSKERRRWIEEKTHLQEDYRALSALKKELENHHELTQKELYRRIADLNESFLKYRAEEKKEDELKEKIAELEKYNNFLGKENQELKSEKNRLIQDLKFKNNANELYLDTISELKKEIQEKNSIKPINNDDSEYYRELLTQTRKEKAELFQENNKLKIALKDSETHQKSILTTEVIPTQHQYNKIDLKANYEAILEENKNLKSKIRYLEGKISTIIDWVKDNMLQKLPKASSELLVRLMPLVPKNQNQENKSIPQKLKENHFQGRSR